MVGLCTVVMWACLCLFWGTNAHVKELLPSLDVQVISFGQVSDRLSLGRAVTNELQHFDVQTEVSEAKGGLVYRQVDAAATYPAGVAQVMETVQRSGPWAAIVIGGKATNDSQDAIDAQAPIGVYYSSVRSPQVVFGMVLPSIEKDLRRATEQASRQILAANLCNATQQPTSPATAMSLAFDDISWARHDVNPVRDLALLPAFSTALIWLVSESN